MDPYIISNTPVCLLFTYVLLLFDNYHIHCVHRREVFKDPNVRISKDINDKELEQAVRFLHDNGQVMWWVWLVCY